MEPGWSFSDFKGKVGGVFSDLLALAKGDAAPHTDHMTNATTILEKTTRVLESAFDLGEGGATLSSQFIDWVLLLAETKTREVCPH